MNLVYLLIPVNKKHTTIASIAAVAVIGASLLLSGVLNTAIAAESSRISSLGSGISPGEATKLVVEIDSPYGHEKITSFKIFVTDNLAEKKGYQMLRLTGPIMDDKRALLHWISGSLNKMPAGLAADGTAIGALKMPKMSKPKDGTSVDMIPMSGKVTLKVLEGGSGDLYATKYIRQLTFNKCHIAGYYLGVTSDDEKVVFKDLQYTENVIFACAEVQGLTSSSTNNRGLMVETAKNDDNRQIVNEKGELIITSREYRQPIVLESYKKIESTGVKKEIVTGIGLDKTEYKVGDAAVFTVTFNDANGNPIDPDTIRAIYNGKMAELQKDEKGVYTFTTQPLIKEHQQLIVSVDKSGFPTDTTYLSIPIHRIS